MHFNYFNSIRFVACLVVVAVHIEILKHYRFQEISTTLKFSYEIGKMAVSVFFVLSGFLIGALMLNEKNKNGSINLKIFYKKRALKILPLYFLLVFFAFVIIPSFDFTYIPEQTEDLKENYLKKFLCFIFLLPQLNATIYKFVPGAEQLWTIGSEVVAYIALPFVVLTMRRDVLFPIKIILGIIGLKILLKAIHNMNGINLEPIIKFVFYNKLDCVLAGCMAAYWHTKRNKFWLKLTGSKTYFFISIFLSASLVLYETYTEFTDSYLIHSILFLIPIGYLSEKQIHQKSFFSFTEILGNYTYSIYIWSYVVLFVLYKITLWIFELKYINTVATNLFLFVTTVLVSIIVGSISYYYIEKPFLKLKK
jgi:peptidoglycan/LPS O-acetylase OafA/YrhL